MNDTNLKSRTWIPRITRLIGILIPLIYFPLMLRLLGQEDYGLHSMADSVIEFLLLLTFCTGGAFATLLTKHREEGDAEGMRRIFGLYIKTHAVIGLVILVAGLYISFHLGVFRRSLNEEELEMLKKICLLMTVDAAVFLPFAAWKSVIAAHADSGFLELIALAVAVLTPCAGLAVLALGWASIGLVSVSIGINLIVSFLCVLYSRKQLDVSPSFGSAALGHLRTVLSSSVFPLLDLCAEVLFIPADRLIIGWALGSLAVAVYNVGASVAVYLLALCALAGGILSPRSEEELQKGSYDIMFIRHGRRQFILVYFVFSAFAIFGRQFLVLWAGRAYSDSYGVVLLTLGALAISQLQEAGSAILHSLGRHRFHVLVFLCSAAVSVLLTFLLVKPWGVLGAAAASFAAYLVGGVAMNIYYQRVIGLDIPLLWKRIARMCPVMILFGAIFWCAVNAVSSVNWAVLIGLFIVYSVLYFLLSRRFMMNTQERAATAGFFRKAWGRISGRG